MIDKCICLFAIGNLLNQFRASILRLRSQRYIQQERQKKREEQNYKRRDFDSLYITQHHSLQYLKANGINFIIRSSHFVPGSGTHSALSIQVEKKVNSFFLNHDVHSDHVCVLGGCACFNVLMPIMFIHKCQGKSWCITTTIESWHCVNPRLLHFYKIY